MEAAGQRPDLASGRHHRRVVAVSSPCRGCGSRHHVVTLPWTWAPLLVGRGWPGIHVADMVMQAEVVVLA
jgi:hypothetical protein